MSPPQQYEAIVVGAGPAGVTCIGNLLDRGLNPILWVDHAFHGGRVNRLYREVPSNTKVHRFTDFATDLKSFREVVNGDATAVESDSNRESHVEKATDKLGTLRRLDPELGCPLGDAADMIVMLTQGLRENPSVQSHQGHLTEAQLDESTSTWAATLRPTTNGITPLTARTKRLILCTGSSPTRLPLPQPVDHIQRLDLDTALSPTLLTAHLTPLLQQPRPAPLTVSLIGASHSAILVLRNLYRLASSLPNPDALRIRWFTRHALRYAEYMDGWILRDNTGLKGEVAEWAKRNLEPEVWDKSDVSRYVRVFSYEKGQEDRVFEEGLPGSDYVVQAVGYTRDPLPALRTTRDVKVIEPLFDHEKGCFYYPDRNAGDGRNVKIPGLYGAGIAWPERVTDPRGNVEYAVGFWKFMKFVRRVSPEWN